MDMLQNDILRQKKELLHATNPILPLYIVIHDVLKSEIISCRLGPGSLLKENELAELFNVSRTTVRNALDTLKLEKFLVQNGRSMQVTNLTRAQYTQLHEFRSYFDPIAAKLAADRYTKQTLDELARFMLEAQSDDPMTFVEADSNFHRMIYVASQNQYILQAYDQIDSARRRINYLACASLSSDSLWEFSRSKRERMWAEHQAIYDAIRSSDKQAAAILSKQHVGSLLFDFDAYEKKLNDKST